MAGFQRQYVSHLVPTNKKVLTTLLITVAIVNSAVSQSPVSKNMLFTK